MDLEELKKQAYHSILLYSIVADAPRMLHVPDAINAAIDGDMELLKDDLNVLMIECLQDLPEYLMSKLNGNDNWKKSIRKKIKSIKSFGVARKNEYIDICNDILDVLIESGINHIPKLRKLDDSKNIRE